MKIRIAPMPPAFLERAWEHGIDDQGQTVRRLRSLEGGEPCRDVLRGARSGEEFILARFCPFEHPGPYKEYGPVFVLSEPAYETVVRDALPLPKGGPDDYFGDRFVLRAYSHGGDILDGELVWSVEAMTNSVAGSRMHRGEITQAHRLRASV